MTKNRQIHLANSKRTINHPTNWTVFSPKTMVHFLGNSLTVQLFGIFNPLMNSFLGLKQYTWDSPLYISRIFKKLLYSFVLRSFYLYKQCRPWWNVPFHQGLHYLQKYLFRGSPNTSLTLLKFLGKKTITPACWIIGHAFFFFCRFFFFKTNLLTLFKFKLSSFCCISSHLFFFKGHYTETIYT